MSDREENGKRGGEDKDRDDRDDRERERDDRDDRDRDRDDRDDRDRDRDRDDRDRGRDRDDKDKERGGGKRETGEAVRWNERGFGFIKPDNGGEDVFCHISSIKDGNMLKEGEKVEYEVHYDERRGKDRAENVTGGFQGDDRGPPPKRRDDRGYGRGRDREYGGRDRDRGYGGRDRGGRDRDRGYGRDRDRGRDRDYRR
mmetsp:Transcript_2256/g.2883  ORF Transcript_2256/g.2883 Transcript_2256/m.2883 type:complete len:199 (+) Transcript_2256:216-812(+)